MLPSFFWFYVGFNCFFLFVCLFFLKKYERFSNRFKYCNYHVDSKSKWLDEKMEVGTLVVVGLGLCALPIASLEYVMARAKREAARKIEL